MEEQATAFDITSIRKDFPVLHQEINGKPLVYLDNAATTQKPEVVINAISDYYRGYNSNIHRGLHTLAERATSAFEDTRESVKEFINSPSREQVIFTKGTTESINLVSATWGRREIKKDDVILVSGIEHHSNLVPWQILAQEKGATIRIIPFNDHGELETDKLDELLDEKVKLVAINHVSNTLGTINPVKEVIAKAHAVGAVTMIDGAQAASHLEIDVQDLDADFYAFSGHKMYGPTGIGVLYGKRDLLESMPPYQGGGEMISDVSYETCSYNDLPYKFEAGTPNIADAIALKSAIDYINNIGKSAIRAQENTVLDYATGLLQEIEGLSLVGTARNKVGVASFVIDGVHPQDMGIILDQNAVAVRTGHHCTQPVMTRLGIPGTIRASFAVYNTKDEADRLIEGIQKAVKLFK